MHPQDNNTPPLLFLLPVPYHRRLYTAELMEGLALVKEHNGAWMSFQPQDGATKAATYKPRSSWEMISSAGPILKNEGTWEEEVGEEEGMEKVSRRECA